ncbi:spermidine synthase [bacterium]|nr:spermidine synthase [bacterium]MBU1882906.1 spermidine synthase [bacterium]
MKDFIYPEMMVHVPLCTHKEPKNILILSNDAMKLQLEISRHENMSATTAQASLDALRSANDSSFEVVLSELPCDAASIAHLSRVLTDDGLLVTVHPALENTDENKIIMQVMSNYFKIIMPYRLENGQTLLLASKAYHPTADVILQRADMLDGLSYYNCDIHPAAFAMGNYIRKEYLGVIKN